MITQIHRPRQLDVGTATIDLSTLQRQMMQIRVLETVLQRLCDSGRLGADLHFTTGQEACSVGVCNVLESRDLLVCHHRMIGWAVSKGVPMELLVAELLGKASGVNHGLAGEMHMQAMDYGFAHTFQLVGTVVPVAAGLAWALKHYKRNGGIAVAVFGDAATANGQFHEGLNIAATMGLPLLLVCENNHLAGNIRPEHYMPVDWVRQRAAGYGIEACTVDGTDVEAVLVTARLAAGYVRSQSRPFLLECDTIRLGKHKQGQGDIRTKEEKQELALRDPLRGIAIPPQLEREVEELVERLFQESPPPLPKA